MMELFSLAFGGLYYILNIIWEIAVFKLFYIVLLFLLIFLFNIFYKFIKKMNMKRIKDNNKYG
jgi:uncharacterized membrane protein